MSKKVQKTLTGAMAAMMATGVVATPAMAETNTTDVDALYKAAYTATEKALNEKTQASINEARKAIDALPKDLDWAIGEFSKQVDTVQHPILVDIIKAIETAQASKSQADINAAKKAIPSDLFDIWKNSYSSAVDKIQQELQKQALDAIEVAKASRKAEDIETAKALVADILTSDDAGMVAWAKLLEEDINSVKSYDVVVTKVDSITTTGVKVSFDALKDALRNVTVEVVDNKGNVVEVDTKKVLIEGETSASFTFTTALRNRPQGVWTVNGVELNLDEINLVNDVKAAKSGDALYNVLKDTTLVLNVKKANATAYYNAVVASENLNTIEDLQKLIDKVNEEVSAQSDVKYLVDMANKGTDNQFKNALLAMNLEKVNTSWLDEYRKEVKNDVTLEDVKDSIKTVNNNKVAYDPDKNLVNGKLDETKIANNIELVEQYYVFDAEKEEDVKDKETLLNKYRVDLAIANVNNADTQASLKSALLNLEKVVNNKNTFEYASLVNEDILSKYVTANTGKAMSVEAVKNILTLGYEKALSEAVVNIATKAQVVVKAGNKVTDAQKNDLLNAYTNLAKVTAKNDKFDIKLIDSNLIVNYAEKAQNYVESTAVSVITSDVKTTNSNKEQIAISEINNATTTEDLLAALKDSRLSLKNIVDANIDAYMDENTESASGFDKVASKEAVQNLVDAVNAAQVVLNSNNIDEVSNAILNFAVSTPGFVITDGSTNNKYENSNVINLSTSVRKDVAEEVKSTMEDVKELSRMDLATKIANAIKTQSTNVTGVNNAKVNVAMVDALNKVSSDFENLSEVEKITVAETFIAKFPTHKDADGKVVRTNFVNYTEIRTLLAECMK